MNRSGLIWVGNSKWGARYGAIDHKGLKEILIPLSRRLDAEKVQIIDSAQGKKTHEQVLMDLSKKSFSCIRPKMKEQDFL